jgi:hypothetical protein
MVVCCSSLNGGTSYWSRSGLSRLLGKVKKVGCVVDDYYMNLHCVCMLFYTIAVPGSVRLSSPKSTLIGCQTGPVYIATEPFGLHLEFEWALLRHNMPLWCIYKPLWCIYKLLWCIYKPLWCIYKPLWCIYKPLCSV